LKFYEETHPPATGYLCLSVGKAIIGQYPSARYSGLLVNLAGDSPSLQKNLEENFSWKEFDALSTLSEADKILYQNYLPAMILLYKNYLAANNVRSAVWKLRLDKLAALTGTTALVDKQMGL